MSSDPHKFFDVTTSSFGRSASEDEVSTGQQLGRRSTLKDAPKMQKMPTKNIKTNAVSPNQRYLYHPDIDFSNLVNNINHEIEVKVEACYLTPDNPNVRAGKIWGTDYYTSTSDFVAIYFHSKFYNPEEIKKKTFVGLTLTFSVSKQRRNYNASKQNGFISKKLNVPNSVNFQTLKLEHIRFTQSWKAEELYKLADKMNLPERKRTKIIPERKDTQVHLRFNNLVFNMNNELAFEYSVINICEKSNDPKDFLSNLLKKYYLVLETAKRLKFVITTSQKDNLRYFPNECSYKVLQINNAQEFDNEHFYKHKLSQKKLTEVVKSVAWKDVIWSETAIKFPTAGFEISEPVSYKFYKMAEGN